MKFKTCFICFICVLLLCSPVYAGNGHGNGNGNAYGQQFTESVGGTNIKMASASFDPVRPNKEAWTCYDYAMNFSENNPDWGLVCMSNNRYFKGESHLVNYKLLDSGALLIHDGLYKSDYDFVGWEYSGYYHFFINESPRRYYKWLIDNRECVTGTGENA